MISFFHLKNENLRPGGTAYEEFMRVSTDVLIVLYKKLTKKKVLKMKVNDGFYKYAVVGSSAHYKSTDFSKFMFNEIFNCDWSKQYMEGQVLPTGKIIRIFYRGGITQVNPQYQGVQFKNGTVIFGTADIKSSYPSIMMSGRIPWGPPVPEKEGDIHFMKITATKPMCNQDGLPFLETIISLPSSTTGSISESRKLCPRNIKIGMTFWITSFEWENTKTYYGLHWKVEVIASYKSISGSELFEPYITKWYGIKNQASKDGNRVVVLTAKMLLNNLYGKLGQNPERTSAIYEAEGDEFKLRLG